MYNIQLGLLRSYMYVNIYIYTYIVGTHRLYLYGYGMDVIIIPGKKECFVSYLGMGKDVSIFWASWMFQVENCDPRGLAACFGPSEGELSIWKHLGHLCFEINADGSSKSLFRKENQQIKKQAQIGEIDQSQQWQNSHIANQVDSTNQPTVIK